MSHDEKDPIVEDSCGNVFADLGLPDAEEMLTKAQIVSRIAEIIDRRGLNQAEAAAVLGVDQPKVSALLRGRLKGFSIERLFRFLTALGMEVEIVIRERDQTDRCAGVHVLTAAG